MKDETGAGWPPMSAGVRRSNAAARAGRSAALRSERHAKAPQPGKLQGWPAQIEPENAAEKIQLDALDPADGQAQIAPERSEYAGAGRREAEPFAPIGIILADRGRRQHSRQLGNCIERGLH